ncbi:periplasmic heavy metal sensor [Klebsiella pneumoniae subsp. pneumoniae]|nr:periplasmic heavy metal sensor [Klebsiella pneumoniae subsp. pneumoniae]
MKRNRTLPLALVTFAALTFASNAAWPTTTGATITGWATGATSQLTQEQQATVQSCITDYYAANQRPCASSCSPNAMSTMRCSRRKKPDSGKIEAVAQEMEGLRQKLDQQRVKFDIALAEAGRSPRRRNGIWRLSR